MAGWPSRRANALKPVAWCTVLLPPPRSLKGGVGRSIGARQAARYGTGVPAREGPPTLARSIRASRGPVGPARCRESGAPGHRPRCGPVGSGAQLRTVVRLRSRMVPLARSRGSTTIRHMQVIAADAPRSRRDRLAVLRSAATGVLLLARRRADRVAVPWHPARQPVHPGRPPDDVPDGARA